MPAKRLSMRKIKEGLRLKWERGLSNRQIAAACSVSRPAVSEYLRRATEAGLSWPLTTREDFTYGAVQSCGSISEPGGRRCVSIKLPSCTKSSYAPCALVAAPSKRWEMSR